MARSLKLVSSLKQQLRSKGITYKHVAEELGLSEASIKHMFAKNHFSLERVDRICEMLNIEISDLATIAESDTNNISQLPLEFEKELIADMRLLLVAYCVMNSWSIEQIIEEYEISETECISYLARLDKMKLIELQPNNRIRLLTSSNFEWHENGPIERFFRQQVQSEFFNAEFKNAGEIRLVKNGSMSLVNRKRLVERLNFIGDYFEELNDDDRNLGHRERHGTTLVVAIRQWAFQAFTQLERK